MAVNKKDIIEGKILYAEYIYGDMKEAVYNTASYLSMIMKMTG